MTRKINMLKDFAACSLNSNILIIEDREDVGGHDLFTALLINHSEAAEISNIYLVCYENPPQFYQVQEKISARVNSIFFSDPLGWSNKSTENPNLELFLSNLRDVSEGAFFIDSLSFLVQYHGFSNAYKILHYLKRTAKKVVCLAHGDLFTTECMQEFEYLSTGFVRLLEGNKIDGTRAVDVTYKKPGGKVQKQREIISVSEDLKILSEVKASNCILKPSEVSGKIGNLTTFKLDLEMSENEKKAKRELVLPYLRTEGRGNGTGEVIYQPEPDELEDDPDDDLDI